MIQFGLRLHDAEKLPIEQVLPLVRQKGFSCVHLALSKSLKEVPNTPGYAAYLRRLFAKNELDIAVLGNYLNLAHPDTDALHAIQEKYYAHIRFASLLGCGMVGTETGAPNAEYKFCPECRPPRPHRAGRDRQPQSADSARPGEPFEHGKRGPAGGSVRRDH